jgi:excinuclease ABC subunit C
MKKFMLDYKKAPEKPGVYIMKDDGGRVLYVGKAGNLRRRVASYFEKAHDARIAALVGKIKKIEYRTTDTALEALILEAELIKKYLPPFNVREKDDKSFLYVEITKEKFPRVLLARGKDNTHGARHTPRFDARFGPFVSAGNVRAALNILRRIFPWSVHDPEKIIDPASLPSKISPNTKLRRACLDYEIGLCPGTCIGAVSRTDYIKNINHLKLFFEGKKKRIIASLTKEMAVASRRLDFEKAEKIRRQIFALQHIRDTALIGDAEYSANDRFALGERIQNQKSCQNPESNALAGKYRIEGYDISNISGDSAVGSMVVFSAEGGENFEPDRDEYRKFKIQTIFQPNDVGMLGEVLMRRFKRIPSAQAGGWTLPNLIVIDGGIPQVNAARRALFRAGLKIPIVGIAKGAKRKRNDIIGRTPKGVPETVLIRVRDEAHRFAIGYHKTLRRRKFLE